MILIAVTMRCPEPRCREACERPWTGEPGLTPAWVHKHDQSPACGEPERIEVHPHKAEWSGRLWRIEEARQAARREASARASAIVSKLQPNPHCGECAAGLRVSIAGAIEGAWERGLAFAQDEYLAEHPVSRPRGLVTT